MEKLLTAKQVSELLEVKTSTVYDWVYRDVIPYIKLGRLVRFKKTDIFHWLDTHSIRPPSPAGGKKLRSRPGSLQKEFPLSERPS